VTVINGSGSEVELSCATATSGAFTVATLTNGEVYSISILKQPNKLSCTLTNQNGVIRAPNSVTNLTLTCVPST